MDTIHARFVGHVFVPEDPVDLDEGEQVELAIRRCRREANGAQELLARLPLIRLSPEDAEAINREPDFDIELKAKSV